MGTLKVNGNISATGTMSATNGFSGNASTSSIPFGFSARQSSWTWGTITSANGYTQLTAWTTPTSGEIAFAEKGQQVSVQIDGYFYQNEGKYLVLDSNNYTSYAPTKTGSGASGTWGISITGNAKTATSATSASLLSIHNTVTNTSTRSAAASTWTGGISGLKYVWGEAFKDTSIGSDTGDLVLGLRAGQYTSGGTELCMMIDGDYYSMGYKVLHANNWSSYCAAKSHSHSYLSLSGGTVSGHLYATSGLSWNHAYWTPNGNVYCTPTGNNQEWSFDVGAAGYSGCYWHVWSAKNGCTMLQCNADNNSVGILNGVFYLNSKCYGGSLPSASYVGQIFFKT